MRGVSTSDLLVRRSPSTSASNSQTNVAERHGSHGSHGSRASHRNSDNSVHNSTSHRNSENSSHSNHSNSATKLQLPTVSTHPVPDTPVNHTHLNLSYASSAIQNADFRSRMNDCHDIHVSESRAFFGVYDGHGGDATALWCKAKLRPLIYAALGAVHERPVGNKPRPSMYARAMSVSQSVVTDSANTSGGNTNTTSNTSSNNLQVPNSTSQSQPRYYTPDLSLRISAAFYKLNEWIVSRSGYSLGGACATVAYIEHTRRESLAQSSNNHDGSMITRLVVANVGDCVCVMSHKGRAQRMTADHTLSAPSERERVVASGGLITHKKVDGLYRVTRSLGDKSFKRYISSRPFVSDTVLGAADEFLILASNGLWDVVDDQTCVDLIRHIDDCKVASDTLVSYALKHGAADNVTVVVVRFVSSDMCREYPSQLGETTSIMSSEGENRRLLSTRRAFSQSGYIPGPGLATLNESKRVHDRVSRFTMFETLTRTHDAIFDNPENYNVIMAAAEMSLKLRGRVGPLVSTSSDRMSERMSSDRMNSIVSMGTVSSCSPRSSLTYSDDESTTPATSMAKRPSISSSSSSGSSFNRRSQYMRSRSQVSGIATFEQLEEMEELDRLRSVNYSGLAQPGDLRAITDTESAIEEDDDEVLEEVDTQLELPRNKKVLFASSTRSQRSSASTLEVARTHSTASTASSSATIDDDTVAERFTSMFNNSRPARKMSRALENISFEPRRSSFDKEERDFDGSNSSNSASNTPSGTPSASQSFISLQRELRDKAHVASHHLTGAASAASGLRHSHIGGFFPEHHSHKKSNSVAIPCPDKGGSGSNSREGSKERSFSVQLGHAPHHISHLLHGSKTRLS